MLVNQQRFLLWTGIICLVLTGVGLAGFARFIPVPGAYLTPVEVAAIYQSNTVGIRIGAILMMIGGAGSAFMLAVLASQMKRIEGMPATLPYTVVMFGGANTAFNILPGIMFSITAFRPDRPIDITAALNDIAWFFAVMNAASFILIQIPIAMACFADRSPQPILPRWLGYLNMWTALVYVPAFGVVFFKTGPFAWHGLLAFYVAAVAFIVWMVCMYVILFKALSREEGGSVPVPTQSRPQGMRGAVASGL